MKLRVKTDRTCDPILRQMAQEAGITVEDLVEVAIYNLVALWAKDHPDVVPVERGQDVNDPTPYQLTVACDSASA